MVVGKIREWYIHWDTESGLYGMSKSEAPIHCAYQTIWAMLKLKGI